MLSGADIDRRPMRMVPPPAALHPAHRAAWLAVDRAEMTLARLADLTGLSESGLRKMRHGRSDPVLRSVEAVAVAAGLRIVLVRAELAGAVRRRLGPGAGCGTRLAGDPPPGASAMADLARMRGPSPLRVFGAGVPEPAVSLYLRGKVSPRLGVAARLAAENGMALVGVEAASASAARALYGAG